MNRWTPTEDGLVIENASKGSQAIVAAIHKKTGYLRTEAAVIKRASRIGVSLEVFEVCPECGAKVKKLERSGMCRRCWLNFLIRREEEVLKELEKGDYGEEEGRKKLAALRRKAERQVKKDMEIV